MQPLPVSAIESERNANDGNHQCETAYQIFNGHKNTAKDKPDNISDCFHLTAITSISTNAFLEVSLQRLPNEQEIYH